MWSPHSSVGAAQSAFYLPIIIAAAYLIFRRHSDSRMAWICCLTFSIVRFTGGILLIEYVNHDSEAGWIIVASIFQGAGVVPLILVLVGLLRLIQALDFPKSSTMKMTIIGLRVLFFVGIILLVAGSVLLGHYQNPTDTQLGHKLAKAGYIVILLILAGEMLFASWMWLNSSQLRLDSKKLLKAMSISFPFLTVRLAYALLSVFDTNPKWSPLSGDIAPLVCMHSLMEYIVVLICVTTGYLIKPVRSNAEDDASHRSGAGKTYRAEQDV
ncbi:hypothetical protein BT63DRAFT_438181 [Microthyrium microscopicum]|uniref:DUF7702 domain-containing protein n=1 Tax=Microthyrium microscopicum TaxID=703497 RepID=A0A6A6UJI0_9PEZI|nr:hypothetical protein BT63DRAFT_438181 [Microthyrium microscopicum]